MYSQRKQLPVPAEVDQRDGDGAVCERGRDLRTGSGDGEQGDLQGDRAGGLPVMRRHIIDIYKSVLSRSFALLISLSSLSVSRSVWCSNKNPYSQAPTTANKISRLSPPPMTSLFTRFGPATTQPLAEKRR